MKKRNADYFTITVLLLLLMSVVFNYYQAKRIDELMHETQILSETQEEWAEYINQLENQPCYEDE